MNLKMKYSCLILLVFTFSASHGAVDFGFAGDILTSTGNILKSVISKSLKLNQSPDDFFEEFKNILIGYPFEPGFMFVSTLCSIVVSEENIKPRIRPSIEKMNYVLKTKDRNISVPLNDPVELWSLDDFNRDWPTVIMVTGWTTNISEGTAADSIYDAYECRGNVNFVLIDTAGFVDTIYSWAAFNTEEIGNILADSLAILTESEYDMENITLIGHSLGAQICGSAGRNFYNKTNKLLPKIIGLDPANPCFDMGESLTGLYRGDADFVIVLHSNPGIFGKADPLGDIDFYVNGLRPKAPGCFTITCSHGRAVEYYAESVYPGNEHNFMAVKCNSLSALEQNSCKGIPIPMGYATPTNVKGNYFLKVNKKSPYGKNSTKNFVPICQVFNDSMSYN
ncbi:vitellogenin-1-like [Contarinia nasturtii]|uniref:vitellogenin-1-like n=1 Tax=Contarinia nasturtii TaxID=265458 RepID=UPI0012D482ED|nr:vitellogenin-1-like [Contarinia nasturtii]